MTIAAGALLSLVNGADVASTVSFAPGFASGLVLGDPFDMSGTIAGFGLGDGIVLTGVSAAATSGTLSADNVLTVTQTNGPSFALAFVPVASPAPWTVNNADGSSLQYIYDPGGTAAETIVRYAEANARGS